MSKKVKNHSPMSADQRKLFEKYYYSTRESVYWYVLKKVGKQENAEDIVAETYVKLTEFPEIISERDESGVKAWLYTVARNKVIDLFRKEGRSPQSIDMEDEVFEIISEEDGDYLEDSIKNEEAKLLLDKMSVLSSEEKELLSLRFYEELQFSEIAEAMDKNEGAVKMMLYRALEKLKSNINQNDFKIARIHEQ